MNKCLNCNKEVRNKFCNISCQNKFQNSKRAASTLEKRYGAIKDFECSCSKCNTKFVLRLREQNFLKRHQFFCSRKCANSRKHSDDTKRKISSSLSGNLAKKSAGNYGLGRRKFSLKRCPSCRDFFETRLDRKFCSRKCAAIKGGMISSTTQNRRSKNEIYFAELCKKHFNNVSFNENIFNGWDADVIIKDFKIAVLWNGKWHYEKITKKHSLLQTQNRDKIKINEIKNCGYFPYTIKDLGRYNPTLVEKEFQNFLKYADLV